MSNLSIAVRSENQKPVFLIQKGKHTVGRFTASLVNTGSKAAGSAFTAIIMRIVTGVPVNVIGHVLKVDPDSIVGENPVTDALHRVVEKYDGVMTQRSMYCIEFGIGKGFRSQRTFKVIARSLGFLDPDGNRISTFTHMTQSRYKVSYSKQAN